MLSYHSVIRMSHLSFLGVYRRGLRGGSRFVWNIDTLRIIIRGFFQFHRSGRRLPLHLIAPHLRGLIREYVKTEGVCGITRIITGRMRISTWFVLVGFVFRLSARFF